MFRAFQNLVDDVQRIGAEFKHAKDVIQQRFGGPMRDASPVEAIPPVHVLDEKDILLCSVTQWREKSSLSTNRSIAASLSGVYDADTIAKRFDALCALRENCARYPKLEANESKEFNREVEVLGQLASQFAMALVDVTSEVELDKKITKRITAREYAPDYMPWHLPWQTTPSANKRVRIKDALREIGLHARGKPNSSVSAEDVRRDGESGVSYLTKSERERFRIFPSQGRLKKMAVYRTDHGEQLVLHDFDTQDYSAHGERGRAIFVISPQGDSFAGSTVNSRIHHPSFLAGGDAFYAGIMAVEKGVLRVVGDYSGHYMPPLSHSYKALAFLRRSNLLNHVREEKGEAKSLQFMRWLPRAEKFDVHSLRLAGRGEELSDVMREQLIADVNTYIDARVNTEEKGIYVINTTGMLFRDVALTRDKVRLACDLRYAIRHAHTVLDVMEKLLIFRQRHAMLEKSYGKTYSWFTKSGLLKAMDNLDVILCNAHKASKNRFNSIG